MRRFLLVLHGARSDADFSVNDLPGNGRMDIGARFLNAALLTSHGVREDVEAFLVLKGEPQPPLTLKFVGRRLQGMHPDERSIGGFVRTNIRSFEQRTVSANRGVTVKRQGIAEVLDEHDAEPVMLHADGDDMAEGVPDEPLFVLGDHEGFSEEELAALADARTVSVGPGGYQAQQVAAFLNVWMDRL